MTRSASTTPRPVQVPPAHGVLEAGKGRLGGQGPPVKRVPVEQQLVGRVLGQPGGVVAVGVATGNAVDALPHQRDQLVLDLAGLPPVGQTGRQPLGNPQAVVQGLEQHRASVQLACLIEPGDDRRPHPLELEGHDYESPVS